MGRQASESRTKKSAKQPQKPWSFPVASDRRNQGLSLLLHIFKVHIRDSDLHTSLVTSVNSV